MNIYDVKKLATYSIEDPTPVGDVKAISEKFNIIKRSYTFDKLLYKADELIINRLRNEGYYIDEYAGCEISAYSRNDYVLSFLLFVSGPGHKILGNSFRRVWANLAFTFDDGTYKLNCTYPTITIY